MNRMLFTALLASACATTPARNDEDRIDDDAPPPARVEKKSSGSGALSSAKVDMKAVAEQAAKQAQAMRDAQQACETEVPDALTDAQLLDLAREREAAFVKNFGPRLDNAAAVKELTRIGRAVAKTAPLQFGLVDSDQPRAFSASDGTVLVTTGLVKKCANEAQLAAVLAHEADHVAKRADEAPRVKTLRAECATRKAMAALMPQLSADATSTRWVTTPVEGLLRTGEAEADEAAQRALAAAGYEVAEFEALVRALGDTNQDGWTSEGSGARRAEKLQNSREAMKPKSGKKPALPKPLAAL